MSTDDLTERLDQALDGILAVRVTLAPASCPALPEEALDAALGLHQGFQAARREFVAALQALPVTGVADDAIFSIEQAAHAMVSQGIEVAWQLGCIANQAKP